MSEQPDAPDFSVEPVYKQSYAKPPSVAVVTAMAKATNRPLTEIETLADWIDPEAVDSLLKDPPENTAGPTIGFEYVGCHVTVSPDKLRIEPQNGDKRE